MGKQSYIIVILFFLILGSNLKAQVKKQEDLINQFEKFKSGIQDKHQNFIDRNDSLFLEFLKQSWKKVNLIKSEIPSSVKPYTQPKISDSLFRSPIGKEIIIDTLKGFSETSSQSVRSQKLLMDEAISYASLSYQSEFNFYGIKASFDVKPDILPNLRSLNAESISNFFIGLIKNMPYWTGQINTLQGLRSKYVLNDWGFFQLLTKASSVYYTSSNEQKLLTWFILLKTGFKVKVAYTRDNIYILLPTREKLFGSPYIKDEGDTFYILNERGAIDDDILTHEHNYPGNSKPISMSMKSYPNLQGDLVSKSLVYKGQKINFSFNRGVLDFLSTYPQCDLKVYFGPGLSEANRDRMDEFMVQQLKGLSKKEALDLLLDFCQKAISYSTDQAQFGKERYLFADESLYFPANDCEDRTILLSYLIERYLKLPTIALDFPGHVNLGVATDSSIQGAHVMYKGVRYLVCDPTYINAKSGMLDPEYVNKTVKIVSYSNVEL